MKAIAAMGRNRVIGANGAIPWHLPEDFKWFKRMTLGGVVVMGRKTFESLGKPLPGRRNVVLSASVDFEGVETLRSIRLLSEALYAPAPVWIIGGASVYAQTLSMCTDLYLSVVDAEPEGDAFFPAFEDMYDFSSVVESHAGFEVRHYIHKTNLPKDNS